MISKEVIEKAKNCTTKEELQELAKSENIELSDADINSFLASSDTNKELSDEELENVNGGCTTYGDGWDNISRPIVTRDNSCGLYKKAENYTAGSAAICVSCKYYSYNHPTKPKRITLVSAWCTNDDRIEGHDVVNDDD